MALYNINIDYTPLLSIFNIDVLTRIGMEGITFIESTPVYGIYGEAIIASGKRCFAEKKIQVTAIKRSESVYGKTILMLEKSDFCFKFNFEYDVEAKNTFDISLLINNIEYLSGEKQITDAAKIIPLMTNGCAKIRTNCKIPIKITWYELFLPMNLRFLSSKTNGSLTDGFLFDTFDIYYDEHLTLHYRNNNFVLGG
jgi:hypothetical protein